MDEQDIDIKIKAALDAAEAANSAKDLKKSMRELNALAEEVGVENAAAYTKIKQAAGEAALKVKEMNASTKALAGTPLQATEKSFHLIRESLMTMNFEQLTKSITLFSGSLQKLNPAQLTEGFGKLGSSLATLGKTLLTNPIFLIGAAVVFIITKFNELKESGGLVGKVFSAIGSAIHAVIKAITAFTDAIGLTDLAAKKAQENRLKYLDKEKSAIEERYSHETKMAELTGKNVGLIETQKFEAQQKTAKEVIAIYEHIKEEKGYLSEEEIEKYKEALQEYKKIQDATAEYAAKVNKEILDSEKQTLNKIRQAKINNLSDETEKKKAQAQFDLDTEKDEITKSLKEQKDKLATEKQLEINAANDNAEAITAINNKYAVAGRIIDREYKAQEVEAKIKKNSEIQKANEEAEKKRLEELKKTDEELLAKNKETQTLITNDLQKSEDERTVGALESLDNRTDILKKELKDKVISQEDYKDKVKAIEEEEYKTVSDYAKKKEADEKEEAAKRKAALNLQLDEILKLALERFKGAASYKAQLEAQTQILIAQSEKQILNENLTGEKRKAIEQATDEAILKLKADYANKEKQAFIKTQLDEAQSELSNLQKRHSLRVGLENKLVSTIADIKKQQLKAQETEELRSVEKGSAAELAIKKKYAQQTKTVDEDTNKARLANFQATSQQILSVASSATNALSSLSDLITQNENQNLKNGEKASIDVQKRQFNRKKALGLVGAIINTAQGVTAALAQEPPLSFVLAALTAVAGGLQIATIASQKFNPDSTSSDTGGSAQTPTISAPSLAAAPSLNNGGSSFRAGQFYGIGTQNYNNNSGNNKLPDQRVYVVESDITNMQRKVSVTQQRASL